MDYVEVNLKLDPIIPFNEILVALLSEIGFESFVDTKEGIIAYVSKDEFDEAALDVVIGEIEGVTIEKKVSDLPHKNWNEEWEKDYHPVVVDERCVIRALFHESMPQFKYELIIQPQMSFGTGHHPTTLTIARMLLDMDLEGRSLLDLGTGTGVLAILAEKMGAGPIFATDIEDHIIENAKENVRHNDCVNIRVDKADLAQPGKETFQVILANINLNALVAGLPMIIAQAQEGTRVVLSGFYEEDAPILIEKGAEMGLSYLETKTHQNWAVLQFEFKP